MRQWRRMPFSDRLKLECAVNLGLPVSSAGKVLDIKQSNLNRVLKDLANIRETERVALGAMDQQERLSCEQKLKTA